MAVDYIIGALIVASMVVNALALGAFWVSPGLRTTANRFVINLLIANLVGCMVVLGPSVFYLYGDAIGVKVTTINTNTTTVKTSITPTTTTVTAGGDNSYDAGLWSDCVNETLNHANSNCNTTTVLFKHNQDELVIMRSASFGVADSVQRLTKADESRFWGYDLTTALGKYIHKLFTSF